MSEIEKYQPPQIAELDQWAQKLYDSGMFTDAKSVAQAFVKVAAGAEIGLTPFQSMTGVHFISGKPVVGAGLLASMLDRPPYNYTVEFEPSLDAPEACRVTVFKNGVQRGQSRYSMDDARRAGLVRGGSNWEKYPSDMLFARAISQAARRYAPGSTGTTFYVEGELTHDEPVATPEGVTAKPRTRVTAEVVQPSEVELDYDPVTLPTVGKQLQALSTQERKDLYSFCGVESKLSAAEAHALFTAKADEFGVAFSDPPDIHAILDRARILRMREVTAKDVDEFDHFAETGQDLSEDPQTAIA
jgi:hypothetical protein